MKVQHLDVKQPLRCKYGQNLRLEYITFTWKFISNNCSPQTWWLQANIHWVENCKIVTKIRYLPLSALLNLIWRLLGIFAFLLTPCKKIKILVSKFTSLCQLKTSILGPASVIFKCVGRDAPNTHNFLKSQSPSYPILCWVFGYNSVWIGKVTEVIGRGQPIVFVIIKKMPLMS